MSKVIQENYAKITVNSRRVPLNENLVKKVSSINSKKHMNSGKEREFGRDITNSLNENQKPLNDSISTLKTKYIDMKKVFNRVKKEFIKKYSIKIKNVPDISKYRQFNMNVSKSKHRNINNSGSIYCDSIPSQNSTRNKHSESNIFNYNNYNENIKNNGSAKMSITDSSKASSSLTSRNKSNSQNRSILATKENLDIEMKVTHKENIPLNKIKNFKPKKKPLAKYSEKKNSDNPKLNASSTNPQLVTEYLQDIYETLRLNEDSNAPKYGYMKDQTDINEKMRAILIDWLVDVHFKFKLVSDTLFLTVNLIDRFLGKTQIPRTKLQLVGITAMFIACKYEEIYAPEVRDFVYITDKAYDKEDILLLEKEMLLSLGFNVTVPTTFRFLEIFARFLKIEDTYFMFSRYLIELFLIEYKMIKYKPSLIASAVLYITFKVTKCSESQKVCKITNYTEENLKNCARDICLILNNSEKNSLQGVRKKFSSEKFLEVAKLKFN